MAQLRRQVHVQFYKVYSAVCLCLAPYGDVLACCPSRYTCSGLKATSYYMRYKLPMAHTRKQ